MGNFEEKEYWEYLRSLEDKMTDSEKSTSSNTEYNSHLDTKTKSVTTPHKKKRGLYKVVKIKKSALTVTALSALILVLSVAIILVGSNLVKAFNRSSETADTTSEIPENTQPQVKIPEKIEYEFPEVTPDIISGNDAKYAIVIDKTNNKVIAARNPHSRAYPASTTKVMTLLVAVENITDYNDTFTMSYALTDPLFKRGASVAGFKNAEVITMTDLIYGLILPSGADAAVGLATKIAGSEEAFVELMNRKVAELGLENTHFSNASGLFDEQNYTTAHDMAVILNAAINNEICKKVLSTKKYTTQKTAQNPEGILLSSTLFDYMYGTEPEIATIWGGKTGFVNQSGYCIASYGENNVNGNQYIIVTLSNSSRWPAFHGQIDLYKEYAK